MNDPDNDIIFSVAASLPVNSTQVLSVAGSRTVLPCYTTLDTPVQWAFHNVSSTRLWDDIYVSGDIINGFIGRFTVNTSKPHWYDLTIANTSHDNAGLYVCIEDDGLGQSHYIKLNVKGLCVMVV